MKKSNLDIIQYILEKTPYFINSQDKDGNTPLHLAVERHVAKSVNSLLSKGADRSIKNKGGKTPVELAQAYVSHSPHLLGAFNATYTDSL